MAEKVKTEELKVPKEKPEEKVYSKAHQVYIDARNAARPLVIAIRMGEKMTAVRIAKLKAEGKEVTAKPLSPAEEKLLFSVSELKAAAYATKKYKLNISLDVRDYITPLQTIREDGKDVPADERVKDLTEFRRHFKKMVTSKLEELSATAETAGKTELSLGIRTIANKADRAKRKEQRIKDTATKKAAAKGDKQAKKALLKGKIEALKAQMKEI